MILIKLMGGLGNQMFQYALARNLQIRNGTKLHLDLGHLSSSMESIMPRTYGLRDFHIEAKIASRRIRFLFSPNPKTQSRVRRQIFTRVLRCTYVKEGQFSFDPAILQLRGNLVLEGYWQSEKYFKSIESTIRSDFGLHNPVPGNENLARLISTSNSVSIHVRRGDYVNDPQTSRVHGVCSLEYYQRAVDYFRSGQPEPHLFVFSDDLPWAREHLKFDSSIHFVSGREPIEDMKLMSLCKHNILANSSFSWWGAWLNGNPDKVVIAPRRWFKSEAVNTKDLLPKDWIQL